MTEVVSQARGTWRKLTRWYAAFLSWLLMVSVAILVLPVAIQIFSRFTDLLPNYIWTEELARFLLVWTVMIGAMIGVRESSHFEVDVWPVLSRRMEAAVRLISCSSWQSSLFGRASNSRVSAGTEFPNSRSCPFG
jgi:TRAP-type transport system small permease protein